MIKLIVRMVKMKKTLFVMCVWSFLFVSEGGILAEQKLKDLDVLYLAAQPADKAAKDAADKAAKDAADKAAAEKEKQEFADRVALEEKAKKEAADKAVAEEKAKQEAADKAAAEEKAKQEEADKIVAEEKAKKETADKAAAEEKVKQEAADKAVAEEKAKKEAADKTKESGNSGTTPAIPGSGTTDTVPAQPADKDSKDKLKENKEKKGESNDDKVKKWKNETLDDKLKRLREEKKNKTTVGNKDSKESKEKREISGVLDVKDFPASKMEIAVMYMASENITPSVVEIVTELLRNNLINSGKYKVIEKFDMDKVIREKYRDAGCANPECAIEVGKALNMQEVVVSSVNKIGSKYIINSIMLDVSSGNTTVTASAECSALSDLSEACKEIAGKLTRDK